jgi:hypothetical protein
MCTLGDDEKKIMSDAEFTDAEILRLFMHRTFRRVEPIAVVTLLRTAAQVNRALHVLDRVRQALGIEDGDFPQA